MSFTTGFLKVASPSPMTLRQIFGAYKDAGKDVVKATGMAGSAVGKAVGSAGSAVGKAVGSAGSAAAYPFKNPGEAAGRVAGSISNAKSAVTRAIKAPFAPRNVATEGVSNFTEGFRAAKGKTPFGHTYAESALKNENMRRLQQGKPIMSSSEAYTFQTEALNKANERLQRVQDFKKNQGASKPSFASRHPVLTGIGAYGAMQMAMGGSGDPQQQQQQSPVVYGNQYY